VPNDQSTDNKNHTVRIIDSQFMKPSEEAVAAAGFNDIYQNDASGGMIQFCCPAPSPSPSATAGKTASTSTGISNIGPKCVAVLTSYLLVEQLPPAHEIVH
jgi:hypothetical protein